MAPEGGGKRKLCFFCYSSYKLPSKIGNFQKVLQEVCELQYQQGDAKLMTITEVAVCRNAPSRG